MPLDPNIAKLLKMIESAQMPDITKTDIKAAQKNDGTVSAYEEAGEG